MKRFPIAAVLVLLFAVPSFQGPLQAHSPAEAMSEAAGAFLAALDAGQKEKATFKIEDEERFNWHFIPRERKGLPLKEMTPKQQKLAHQLMTSALSHRGYLKATNVISLEIILHEMENRSPRRDPELYYFTIFGEPNAKGTWGWRVEGHHLSLNFTLAKGRISVTPSFFGANPAEVRSGPRKGLRVLAEEEDLGRKLVRSLDERQSQDAIFSDAAPPDIITGADRKARVLKPLGISMSQLRRDQAELLWNLIEEYVHRYRPEVAAQDLDKIQEAGPKNVAFAWAGSLEPGEGHYYRVQGPTFLLEYDNTQNNANHIHTVWRDFENDFGEDILRRHYEEHAHPDP
jgi:hypothetical protein